MDTIEVLDLSKENILPLRQGRRASHLKTALQAQVDPETQQMIQKKREEYEFMIRMYEGNDPLEPYYNYVIWLEQSFPKMGRENNVVQLLEDALIKFKDIEKYKQDSRLIQLIIKYLSIQPNPLELFKLVYQQGLGTMCTSLYKAWAEEYEKMNDIKGADEIYKLGIRCRAQPLNELENAHVQFQLSVARRMIDGTLSPNVPVESSRTALSKLKSSSIKTSRIGQDSAGILPLKEAGENKRNSNTLKFRIYEEDETDKILKRDFEKSEKFPRGSVSNRENIMRAGKWGGQKQKQSLKPFKTSSTPSFYIHEDPEAECSNMKTDYRPRALKLRKDDFNPPIAVFEPPDPTKKPMYPKQLVYVGGRDVQLEEIRAAHYWKNHDRNSNEDENPSSIVKNNNTFYAEEKNYRIPVGENERVQMRDIPESQMESNYGFPSFHHSPSTSMTVNTQAAVNIIQQMWESPLAQVSDARRIDNGSCPSSNKPIFSNSFDTSSVPPIKSSILYLNDENKSKSSSAFEVYTDDLATPINDSFVPHSNIHSQRDFVKAPTFNIFCDENSSSNKKSIEVNFEASNSKATNSVACSGNVDYRSFDSFNSRRSLRLNGEVLSIFQDGSDSVYQRELTRSKNDFIDIDDADKQQTDHSIDLRQLNSEKYSANAANMPLPLIIPVNLEDTPLESENKENQPPQGYISPSDCRLLSGILTPSTNIQLEEQQSDDSDIDDGRNEMCPKYLDMNKETFTTEAFSIPLPTSTPFSLHQFRAEKAIHDRVIFKSCPSNYQLHIETSSQCASDGNVHKFTSHENTRQKALVFQQLMEKSRKPNSDSTNLSSISENSKEIGGFSMGSRC